MALLSETLKSCFPPAVIATHQYRGDDTVTVRRENLIEVVRFLKEDPSAQMNFLMDLGGVDYLTFGKKPPAPGAFFSFGVSARPATEIPDAAPWPGPATGERFEVVYHFFSLALKHRLRVKVPVPESDPVVDTVSGLWATANWFEREVWDMVGIKFRGHPNLKRILMYESFEGHPLRKDYPAYS